MGFLDKIKKKAQDAVGQMAPPPPQAQAPQFEAAPAPQVEEEPSGPVGPTFTWSGDVRSLPQGWDGLSMEDWFYKFETLRDRMMHIDDEQGLQPMNDEDGDPLDPEEVLLITEFGFRSGGDYEAYRNWSVHNWAQQTGENPTDCEFRLGGIARERIMAEKAGAMSGAGGALEPVEGVSCEAWAQIQAQIAGGAAPTGLIAAAGMDQAKWDRVGAEWMARMSTPAVATVYGNAFASGAVGQYGGAAAQAASAGIGGDVGAEPVPFEKFVEISEALRFGHGLDTFGMSPADWSNIGMYWNKKLSQEASKYHQLYTQYGATYEAKYGNGDGLTNDQREEMITAKILEMVGAGQGSQILPYLKDYFPDDADDMDVMDGWFDRACDACETNGDRERAQALLVLRYPLQEDEEDPLETWVARKMDFLF